MPANPLNRIHHHGHHLIMVHHRFRVLTLNYVSSLQLPSPNLFTLNSPSKQKYCTDTCIYYIVKIMSTGHLFDSVINLGEAVVWMKKRHPL